jgi:23S rRNA (cytidine1920-2'-O)/16S rRNA (cytidine1409-2'-O)-methyltransferase
MKQRLDTLITERGLAPSREKAKAIIMSGVVFVDGRREDKAGTNIDTAAEIEVRGSTLPYVGRGALKLEKAAETWQIDFTEKICMDIGASTGGFTDYMLQHGAKRVYAVDVGYGQLDLKLRNDPRVTVMERTNVRYLDPQTIGPKPQIITIDVSFISLHLILPVAAALLKEAGGTVIALVKPQFEAGREQVGKGGIIKDPKIHEEVIQKVKTYFEEAGFKVEATTDSPITGAKGNKEFLMLATLPHPTSLPSGSL